MDHEEIVRRTGPWAPRSPADVSTLFADYPGRWWVADGWAIDALTLLTDGERRWLRDALDLAHPGHPWADALR